MVDRSTSSFLVSYVHDETTYILPKFFSCRPVVAKEKKNEE